MLRWLSLRSSPGPIWCTLRIGVGPVLFFIFIYDLSEILGHLFTSLLMIVFCIGTLTPQWIARSRFPHWKTDWQKFNVAKCHLMRVTRHLPDKQIQLDYSLRQQKLKHVQSAKYLGISIRQLGSGSTYFRNLV